MWSRKSFSWQYSRNFPTGPAGRRRCIFVHRQLVGVQKCTGLLKNTPAPLNFNFYIQGGTCGQGKAFVDIIVGIYDNLLGWCSDIIYGPRYFCFRICAGQINKRAMALDTSGCMSCIIFRFILLIPRNQNQPSPTYQSRKNCPHFLKSPSSLKFKWPLRPPNGLGERFWGHIWALWYRLAM